MDEAYKDYCKKCKSHTYTIYNDFMVGFCNVCKTMRNNRSYYGHDPIPFECIVCGRSSDETYPGQVVCLQCKLSDGD